ncbi:MAG: hypothetical protein ACI90V_014114, partial [Bacillariaceae sp.]
MSIIIMGYSTRIPNGGYFPHYNYSPDRLLDGWLSLVVSWCGSP